jgi:type IV secretory pathway TraG/TraD family ATPase VirD4
VGLKDKDSTPSFWDLFAKAEPKQSEESGSSSFWDLLSSREEVPKEPPPCALRFDRNSVFWAMRNLPVSEVTKHFLVCGATGSGKTIAIRLFLQSIAERFQPGSSPPEQLVIFDVKGDIIPLLDAVGLGPQHPHVHLLNPYDTRATSWNLGEATQTPLMARTVAALLVPEERHSSAPFFADAGRELVYAVILALNLRRGPNWSFRDLLCALDSRDLIARVTGVDRRASRITKRILGDSQHSSAVLSTLATKVARFEQVAALWNTNANKKTFTIENFLNEPGVLILGNDPVLRESLWPINAVLLKALTNEILRRPDTREPRTWFVLDEVRAMERLDCIHDLLNRGRSKGASVLLGIQSIEGLFEVYGEHGANDILGQCANKAFLRAGSHSTAEWAERHFNKVRQMETSYSESQSSTDRTYSQQHALHERSMFLASFFLDLPFPQPGGPYTLVCDVPCLRETLIVRRWFDDVLSLCRAPTSTVAVDPRTDADSQSLAPWTEEEEEQFLGPQTNATGSATGDRDLPGRWNLGHGIQH